MDIKAKPDQIALVGFKNGGFAPVLPVWKL